MTIGNKSLSKFRKFDLWISSLSLSKFVGLAWLFAAPFAVVVTGNLWWMAIAVVILLPIAWVREKGKERREE